jgi:ATP-dependent Clp protease, protease subunit
LKKKTVCDDDAEDCEIVMPFDPGKVYQEQLGFREIILTGDIADNLIEKAVIPIINFNRYDDEMEETINKVSKEPYKREPIRILIHTGGGAIEPCMSLVSAIKSSKTPIHTIALGKAYSAGFLILIAGHERFAQEFSSVMIHPGSGGYIGTFPSIIKHADKVHELQERINGFIRDHSYISMEDLQEMCEHETDWYMYAEEALCRGVIDGIIVGEKIINLEDYIIMKKAEEKARKPKPEVTKEAPKPKTKPKK